MKTCAGGSEEGVGRNAALMESELKMRSLIYDTPWPQPVLLSVTRGALVASGNSAQIQETTGETASADVLSSGILMKYIPPHGPCSSTQI